MVFCAGLSLWSYVSLIRSSVALLCALPDSWEAARWAAAQEKCLLRTKWFVPDMAACSLGDMSGGTNTIWPSDLPKPFKLQLERSGILFVRGELCCSKEYAIHLEEIRVDQVVGRNSKTDVKDKLDKGESNNECYTVRIGQAAENAD